MAAQARTRGKAPPTGGKAAPYEDPATLRHSQLASRAVFYTRFRRAATYAHMSWLDAFHQSALLLSGMGPVVDIKSTAGKIFDGIYALFCGVILLASTGLMFAPVIHRLLHRFHIEDAGDR